jgi:hypothetical protein
VEFILGPVGRFLVVLVLIAAAGATGFVKGIEWDQGKTARAEVNVLTKRIETTKTVHAEQREIASAYERGKASRDNEFDGLQGQLDAALGRADRLPPVCDLTSDDLRLWNAARTGARGGQPDRVESPPSVPGPSSGAGRPAGDAAADGDRGREAVSGLRGSAAAVGGGGVALLPDDQR